MRRALVFCGQGSHKKRMAMDLIKTHGSRPAAVWNTAHDRLMQKYNVHLGTVIHDDPAYLDVRADAFDAVALPTTLTSSSTSTNEGDSTSAAGRHQRITSPKGGGVMELTYVAQPAMVSAQLVMLEHARERSPHNFADVCCVAGHSLGEFTALASLGIFPVDVVVDLAWRRGVLMHKALDVRGPGKDRELMMYACNPSRAQLHASVTSSQSAGDVLGVLVELVAQALRTTTSFVELVNANIHNEQYVVAGDAVGLSVLGKLLDPQFRANAAEGATSWESLVQRAVSAVYKDGSDGVSKDPNLPAPADFVPASAKRYGQQHTFKRTLSGPDDGFTLGLDRLTHLTLEEDGRSGLKRKSWFVPLKVATPFHSSLLRRAVDPFYELVQHALPSDAVVSRLVNCSGVLEDGSGDVPPTWVTNITGTPFSMGPEFRAALEDAVTSENIGEISHHGKFSVPHATEAMVKVVRETSSPRALMAVALAAQLAHPVQWTTSMESMVRSVGVTSVVEVSPVPTLIDMFHRSKLLPASGEEGNRDLMSVGDLL